MIIQLRLVTDSASADALESLALALGAQAVTFEDEADQPLYELAPGESRLWDRVVLSALFEAEQDAAILQQTFSSRSGLPLAACRVEILEDKDWVREWLEQYQPIQCGERLWICPSWKPVPDPAAVNLILDPGLAFGTGTHPTTRMCLEWLESHAVHEKCVIDYGCGSGILAIAALLLGANEAWGVDHDRQALVATQANASRNNLNVAVYLPDDMPLRQADVVLANILAAPLVALAPQITALTMPGGTLIMSGILEQQAMMVRDAYATQFTFQPSIVREGWVLLVAVKHN